MMTPISQRISIITPSFQQAPFLDWTIQSVLRQNYPALEYMVIDGGSTDGSIDVIRSHAARLAWWCSERDGGQTQALNKGFRRCTGEIVGYINSDDMLLPGSLRAVADAFRDDSVEAICGWGIMMSTEGRVRRRWVFPAPTASILRSQSVLMQPSVFWRRTVFDRVGFFDESFRLCMDQEFFARMAARGIVPRLVRKYLSAYRKHANTKTNLGGALGEQEFHRIVREQPSRGQDALWSARSKVLRFALHKATAFLPPYARGTDIHRLMGG
jgi:glycosyltransferase involved in cell wall biosynthesis